MRKLVTLGNGVRLLLLPQADVSFIGIAVSIAAGSRYEREGEVGITHLLEHLLLHECRSYDSQAAYSEALDGKTMDLDAFTEPTALTVRFDAQRSTFVDGVDLLANLTLRPRITRPLVDDEIGRVAEERMMTEDDPVETTDELVDRLVFRGSTLERSVDGSLEQLHALTVRQVLNWHQTITCGRRLTIAITGDINPELAEQRIWTRFHRLQPGAAPHLPAFRIRQQRPRIELRQQSSCDVQISVAFPTFGFDHPDRLALCVLNNHLGDERRWSTRLALNLLGQNGVYWAKSTVWHYRDVGVFKIATAVRPDRVTEVLRLLRQELERLVNQRLSRRELELTVTYLKRDARLRKYDPSGHAAFYARQLLANGDILTSNQFVQRVNAIRARDILRVARLILRPERLNAVLLGPLYGLTVEEVQKTLMFSP